MQKRQTQSVCLFHRYNSWQGSMDHLHTSHRLLMLLLFLFFSCGVFIQFFLHRQSRACGEADRRAEVFGADFRLHVSDKYEPFQLKGLDDYKEFKRKCDAKSKSRSRFIKERLIENVQEQSNGESGLYYFTNSIKENALYLLDEPENSLSASLQLKLKSFLEDSARFYHCQFIISTHSPFLLSMQGAKIYDLDSDPIDVKPWTQLENVKTYYSFFKSHEKEFF